MDKHWPEMNKEMQALIAKKATFKDGIVPRSAQQ